MNKKSVLSKAMKIILTVFLVIVIIGACFGILAHRNIHTVTFMTSDFEFSAFSVDGKHTEKLLLGPGAEIIEKTKSNIWGYVDQPGDCASAPNFAGWYIDPQCTIPFDFTTDRIHSDITLYAKNIKSAR